MIIIPKTSFLYNTLDKVGKEARFVFFAGLPGVGKSLLLQQFALMAHSNGRKIHSLQWDVTRAAFEGTAENQAKYPEIDGSTQPIMRKAVGLWAREGLVEWQQQYSDPAHILVGELPLIGNRLIELVQKASDPAEALLADKSCVFFLPVPSIAVRQVIENAREASIANPKNQKEEKDAQPNILRDLWRDVARIGYELGMTTVQPIADVPYDPAVYTAVYQYLLQHRHTMTLNIDTLLSPQGSAYDIDIIETELAASETAVARIMQDLETNWTMPQIEKAVAQWMML